MSQYGRARNVIALVALGGALAAGCSSNSTSGGPEASSSSTTATTTTSTGGANPLDNDVAAKKLCDALRPELGTWGMQTPTPSRIAYNVTLLQWAFDAGGVNGNIKLIGDKSVVDRLTTHACPDVRNQALSDLNVSNLAAAVAP